MIQLSEHFSLEEFQTNDPIPAQCAPAFAELSKAILEPVRAWFGKPVQITSGYRSPAANVAAHGISNSEHIATADWCACDFFVLNMPLRTIFDEMRTDADIPFHQLILEHGANGSSVIHVSWNRLKQGIRSVLEGATHNDSAYTPVDYVAYNPTVELNLEVDV